MTELVVVALVLGAVYVGACTVWPYASCSRCTGGGKHRSPSGRAWRSCRACGGTGRRVRVGRRIYEGLRRYR